MNREVKVVCTGRGKHKRHDFNTFAVSDAGIALRPVRTANMADLEGLRDDEGVAVVLPALMPLSCDPRYGRDAWRWQCPVCSVDVRLAKDAFSAWLIEVATGGGRFVDVSQHT